MALTGLLPFMSTSSSVKPGVSDSEDDITMPTDLHLHDHFNKVVARQDAIEKTTALY